MKLNSLKLRNFKGIKELKIDAEGNNLDISGNGTGKTLYLMYLCGYCWIKTVIIAATLT